MPSTTAVQSHALTRRWTGRPGAGDVADSTLDVTWRRMLSPVQVPVNSLRNRRFDIGRDPERWPIVTQGGVTIADQ